MNTFKIQSSCYVFNLGGPPKNTNAAIQTTDKETNLTCSRHELKDGVHAVFRREIIAHDRPGEGEVNTVRDVVVRNQVG